VGITAGSREVPGRNACDGRHTYRIIIIMMVIMMMTTITITTTTTTTTIPKTDYCHSVLGKHRINYSR